MRLLILLLVLAGCEELEPPHWKREREQLSFSRERLPVEQDIGELSSGSIGWVVPWAIQADDNGRYWLNSRYTLHPEHYGTASVKIEKGDNCFRYLGWQSSWGEPPEKLNRRTSDWTDMPECEK